VAVYKFAFILSIARHLNLHFFSSNDASDEWIQKMAKVNLLVNMFNELIICILANEFGKFTC